MTRSGKTSYNSCMNLLYFARSKELQAQLKYMEEQYAQTATQLEAEKTRCKELQGDCATATAKVSKLCEENAVLAERFKSLKRESGVKEDSLRLHAQTLADERVRQLESAIHVSKLLDYLTLDL